jgi:bifunctional N-acetylglucosamine-1-phosphate-uridyltransferase/glucosamine-1-phosphate-acetyltransferase GlmU-like protein
MYRIKRGMRVVLSTQVHHVNSNAKAMVIDVVIMAAGKGTRMKSKTPKVLHSLAGRALLQHVLNTATEMSPRNVVVITGHGAQEVQAACEVKPDANGCKNRN